MMEDQLLNKHHKDMGKLGFTTELALFNQHKSN